jgi:hypothetical protein
LTGKFLIVERQPPFIDDEQSRSAIEPSFNAMKQIGQDGRRDGCTDQPIGFKDLDGAFAETFELRIKKPAIRSPKAVGLEGALQHIRL